MPHLPGSLDELLILFRGCFTQPTFQTFRALVAGQISQIGLHTVCGMLVGARLSAIWHHCVLVDAGDERIVAPEAIRSKAGWSPFEVGP